MAQPVVIAENRAAAEYRAAQIAYHSPEAIAGRVVRCEQFIRRRN